jgi:hypothetical protein
MTCCSTNGPNLEIPFGFRREVTLRVDMKVYKTSWRLLMKKDFQLLRKTARGGIPSVPAMVPANVAPSRRRPLHGSSSENERLFNIGHFGENFSDRRRHFV